MSCPVSAAAAALALLSTTTFRSAPSSARAPAPVREIADLMLPDVAVAVYDSTSPIIFYNPRRMATFGPAMRAFFLAHEHAHIELKHTRANALGSGTAAEDRTLQQHELQADCLAAERLEATGQRAVALEAMRYFARQRGKHFDDEHPAGTVRARNILRCLDQDEAETEQVTGAR
ncbi:MAG TPA: ImmA/IrrE family metallo-endopeptidase [Gemmatimonadales bacterium]|nr:ImmA/IrrE family metallo-endopeptidase [Gemmatimonadales bacterium]